MVTSVAFEAHGDAYVGLLQRWCVIYAVARHRHDLLVGLNGFHQPELVFRTCARENVDVFHFLLQRGSAHLFDLGPGDRGLAISYAEHLGDCCRGDLVIARYHRDPNAAAVAFLDRFDGFLAGRVQQPDQPDQDQGLWQFRRAKALLYGRIFKPRQGQHALALRGKLVRSLYEVLAIE